MEFYSLLTAVTLIISVLAWFIWRKTRSIIFPIGIATLYYWSIYGGWSIVADRTGGYSGLIYGYLEQRLFPIYLDRFYCLAILLYSLFIILVELSLLWVLNRTGHKPDDRIFSPIEVDHVKILTISLAALAASFLLIRNDFMGAVAFDIPAYSFVRWSGNPFFTIHQTLNRAALFPLVIGFMTLVSGRRSVYLTGAKSVGILIFYLASLAALCLYCILLGNKNELFTALLIGILMYLYNSRKPKIIQLSIAVLIMIFMLGMVNILRGMSVHEIAGVTNWQEYVAEPFIIMRSTEAFGSHFSMYGVLAQNIPITYGSSFISLLASVVPRIFWKNRPDDIYVYYATNVRAAEGQGYTVHHATGWYLNFGIIGVIIGAVVLAFIWAKLYNNLFNFGNKRSYVSKIFAFVAPFCFTASLAALVRGGLEGYKGIVVDAFLIPTACIVMAIKKRRMNKKI